MPITPQQTIVDTTQDPSLGYIQSRDVQKVIASGGSVSTTTDRGIVTNTIENVTRSVTKVIETNVNADWNATTGTGVILNKPNLNAYATTTYVDNALANVSGGSVNPEGVTILGEARFKYTASFTEQGLQFAVTDENLSNANASVTSTGLTHIKPIISYVDEQDNIGYVDGMEISSDNMINIIGQDVQVLTDSNFARVGSFTVQSSEITLESTSQTNRPVHITGNLFLTDLDSTISSRGAISLVGAEPDSNTHGGDVYLLGGMSLVAEGGPNTRGGEINIAAGQGSNDVEASHGGSLQITSGPAARYAGNILIEGGGTYGASGEAGSITIQSGSSISGVAGNINIQSGVGTSGMQIFEGAVKVRGANVELTSSYESLKINTGDVDNISNPAHVWEFDNSGVLKLPSGGDIVTSTGRSIIAAPGEIPPGQTGNIIFFDTQIYNTVETTNIDIYTNSENYSEVWLKDAEGVYINNMNPAAGLMEWKFGIDGRLVTNTSDIQTLGNMYLYTGGSDTIGSDAGQIDITDTGVTLWGSWSGAPSEGVYWNFWGNAVLQLPAGGDIVDSTGQSVLGGGAGTGLASRTTTSVTTSSVANGLSATSSFTAFKGYLLYKIQTSAAARVRLYTDLTSRTNDASRQAGVEPALGVGLITEIVTTGAETVVLAPAVYGFNNESSVTNQIPATITNLSGSTTTITVTLTVLQTEV